MKKVLILLTLLILTACQEEQTSSLGEIKARIAQQQALVQEHDDLVVDAEVGTNRGNKAPDFVVSDIDNNIIQLSKLEKPTLLYFFATWCPYCRNDLNVLKDVAPNYKDKVNIIAVDQDLSEDSDIIRNYRSKFNLEIPFAVGNPDILTKYQVRYTTTKFAIKDGTIIYKGSGEFSKEQWETLLNELL